MGRRSGHWAQRLPFYYGWLIVGIAFVTMAIGVTARTAFSLLLPPLIDEFGWERGLAAGAFSFGFLVSAILSPFVGKIIDVRGPRVVILTGAALMSAGLFLSPWITTPWHLYATLGVAVGGGASMMTYTAHSQFLPNWFVWRRGLAISIAFAGAGVGAIVLLPWLQGIILVDGWRASCVAMGLLVLLVIGPLSVLVLSKLFRRLMLERLAAAHKAGRLTFFGEHAHLCASKAFANFLRPLKRTRWFVYSKRPFAGPKAVLAYLSRYTHRVAISNSRLIRLDDRGITFRVEDYRVEGPGRYTAMTLGTHEFMRRFLIHVLPKGFHRIRHYGLLAGGARDQNIAQARQLLEVAASTATDPEDEAAADDGPQPALATPCPCCGGRMMLIETFEAGRRPRHAETIRIDTS